MELSHLQTFLLLAKQQFSHRRGFASYQPAVSQQIRALEEELGQVFRPAQPNQPLTADARRELFLPYARQIALSWRKAGAVAKPQPRDLPLSFTAVSTTITWYLPRLLQAYKCRVPAGELVIKTGSSHEVVELVLKGEADFGFVNTRTRTGNLKCFPRFRERILLVVPGEWKPPAMPLRLPDLDDEVLLLPSPRSGFRDFLNESFRRHRLAPRIFLELDDLEGIKEMVRIGLGVSFLPESAVRSVLSPGALKTYSFGEEFSCPTFLLSLPEKFWTRAMREFAGLLREKFGFSGLTAQASAHVDADVCRCENTLVAEDTCTYEHIRMPVDAFGHESAPAHVHTPIYTHKPPDAGVEAATPAVFSLTRGW